MNQTSRAMKESAEEVEEFVSNCPFIDANIDEMYIYKRIVLPFQNHVGSYQNSF